MANRWSKLGSYHSNETYSDLTVVTDDNETFRLHRIVVSTISAYFEKVCSSNFQVCKSFLTLTVTGKEPRQPNTQL